MGPDEPEQVDAVRPRPAPALASPLSPGLHTVVSSDPLGNLNGRGRARCAAPCRSHDAIPAGPRQRTSAACRASALARDSGCSTGSVSPSASSRRASANCAWRCSANRACGRGWPAEPRDGEPVGLDPLGDAVVAVEEAAGLSYQLDVGRLPVVRTAGPGDEPGPAASGGEPWCTHGAIMPRRL